MLSNQIDDLAQPVIRDLSEVVRGSRAVWDQDDGVRQHGRNLDVYVVIVGSEQSIGTRPVSGFYLRHHLHRTEFCEVSLESLVHVLGSQVGGPSQVWLSWIAESDPQVEVDRR